MKSRLTILTLIVLAGWSIFSCSGSDQKTITVEQLSDSAATGKDFYLLDVRTYREFISGHLPFADETIPHDSLQYRLSDLPTDKNTTIYCFCRTGRRSGIATDFLTKQGYTNVYNVEGGITAWEKAGLETVTGPLTEPAAPNNSTAE